MRGTPSGQLELLSCQPGENAQLAHHSNTESQHAVPKLTCQLRAEIHQPTCHQKHDHIEGVVNFTDSAK